MKKHPLKSYFWSVAQGLFVQLQFTLNTQQCVYRGESCLKVKFFTKSLVCWDFSGQKNPNLRETQRLLIRRQSYIHSTKEVSPILSSDISYPDFCRSSAAWVPRNRHKKGLCAFSRYSGLCSQCLHSWAIGSILLHIFQQRKSFPDHWFLFLCLCQCIQVAPHLVETVSHMKLKDWRVWEPFVEYRHLLPVMRFL